LGFVGRHPAASVTNSGQNTNKFQKLTGPWERAELRTPLSQLTWVIWKYDWPFQSGKHTFTVRCYERNGTPQIMTLSPAEPIGATGLYSKSMML
jgi:hypothetical protein